MKIRKLNPFSGKRRTAHGSGAPPSRRRTALFVAVLFAVAFLAFAATAQNLDLGMGFSGSQSIVGGGYVGSKACKECHKHQYEAYEKFSRKSRAFEAVEKMQANLTEEEVASCYQCHATGYGKPTGFESPDKTPDLKNVGCEACHGPGRLHTQSMEMAHIVKTVTIDVCERCHKSEQVKSFRYKSVIYAGAH